MPDLTLSNIIDAVWGEQKKEERLELPVQLWSPITHEDVEYVCNYFYPFLRLANVSGNAGGSSLNPSFILLPNNWVVYDYINSLCTAVPHFYRKDIHGVSQEKQEKITETGDETGGEGTIVKQQFDAAFEIMNIAKERGWTAVQIIDGTQLIKFYAWIAAQELGISLEGFMPTDAERKRYLVIDQEVKRVAEERRLRQRKVEKSST